MGGFIQAEGRQVSRTGLGERLSAQGVNTIDQHVHLVVGDILGLGLGFLPLVVLLFKGPVSLGSIDFQMLDVEGGEGEQSLVAEVGGVLLELVKEIVLYREDRI